MESYRLGKRQISHRKRGIFVLVVTLLLVGVSAMLAKHYLKADTVISSPPPPATTHITDSNEATKHFDEGLFGLDLPKDWVFVGHTTARYSIYTWHNTKTHPGIQKLQVYVDTIPTNLGVNRVLPVQSGGSRVIPTTVSDNCSDFTGNKLPGSLTTPAKWGGIDFLCDLSNYERDVVGTSSSDGINTVTVTGSHGSHKFFFAYTDNSETPNFTIFTNAVQSFRLK